jgi:anaerobic selenocysteine-containing dehydrogenase
VLQRLESHFNIKAPTHAGYDTLSCVEAAHRGEMDACLCVGGNLFGATPDAAFTAGAFAHLDMVVYVSTTLNTGHAHGLGRHTLILPALARDEEPQQTTQESMFNFVRLSNGGPARHEGPRSETDILASLARLVFGDGGPVDWAALASHRNIRQLLSRIIPGLEPLAEIDETRREFHIPGRLRHEPRFPTPSGKARFQVTSLPDSSNDASTLRLMTLRSEGQFNTVVYEDEDLYRGQDRRNVILMHAKDMRTLGLREDQAVVVTSEAGRLANVRARVFDVRPGNAAMYFPEANVLVPRRRDPRSQTPAYKSVLIRVRAQAEPISDRPVSLGAGFEKRKLRAC